MKRIFLFAFLIIISQNVFTQSISGKLSSCTGSKFIRADIQIISNAPAYPKAIIKTFKVSESGKFKVDFDNPGFYRVRFCGVGHEPLDVPLYIDKNENIQVDVKLSPNYKYKINDLKLVGDFNHFAFDTNAVKMIKKENGNYVASIKASADTLAYEVWGIANNNHSVDYPQADYFVPDYGGDYASVIKTKKNTLVKIIVKISELNSKEYKPAVKFEDNNTITAFVYSILQGIKKGHLGELNGDKLSKEKSNLIKFAKIRQGLVSDTVTYKQLADHIKLSSPIWSIYPEIIPRIISIYPKERQLDFLENFIEKNKDETIKPYLYQFLLGAANDLGKRETVVEYYRKFESKYSGSRFYNTIRSQYSPDRNIQVGRILPNFSFKSIDDSTLVLNNKKMRGKIYLVDFWATWCAPCVAEMKYLQKAYEDYESKGLKIISVSLDHKIDDVRKFRKGKWKLPWFNSYLKYYQNNRSVKIFELTFIPKTILVNEKGKIIATGMQLRGEALEKTLDSVFNN